MYVAQRASEVCVCMLERETCVPRFLFPADDDIVYAGFDINAALFSTKTLLLLLFCLQLLCTLSCSVNSADTLVQNRRVVTSKNESRARRGLTLGFFVPLVACVAMGTYV